MTPYIVLIAALVSPGPAGVLVADGAAVRVAAESGLRGYGWMGQKLVLEDTPAARDVLGTFGLEPVSIVPGVPLYAVAKPRGEERLVQMSDAAALAAARENHITRLSDRPFPVRVPARVSYPMPTEPDSSILRIIGRISPDTIHARLARLEAFRTRYSPTDSCRAAEDYLLAYLDSLGVDTVWLDSYPQGGSFWRNVVGQKRGRVNPDKVILITGHLDSESEDHFNLAPGIEDDASGTMLAIEAARVLVSEQLDQTVRFVAFTGEEQGLFGSDYHARAARYRNEDIIAVMHFDMVGWPGGDWGVALVGVDPANRLAQFQARMAALYTTLSTRITNRSFPSDSRSFDNVGYPATSGYEFGPNGYVWYHTTGDTLGNISMPLCVEVAKMVVASAATLARAPLAPESLVVRDVGDGASLLVTWQASAAPDLAGYKLLWGRRAHHYSDSLVIGTVTSWRIGGLLADSLYFVTVEALDSAGFESGPANEASGTPALAPAAVQGVAVLPFWFGNALSWLPNQELDLEGYNLYRSTSGPFVRLNPSLVSGTSWRDSGLESDTMYHYFVTAIDSAQHESDTSEIVRAKPVTLDHGILLVDETRNGNGQPGSPSDAQQDAFYHALLAGYRYVDWDVATEGVPVAGDFGPFSTIVWHADDYTQQQVAAAVPGLGNHLAMGGRLWYVGWKPVLGLTDSGGYPFGFGPGDFCYDALHLSGCRESPLQDFVGASGAGGYPDVSVDSTKLYASFRGRIPYVDAPLVRDAEPVLTFNSASGDTFQGRPVGTRWLGGPGRAVLFGFPLYYTHDSLARQVALAVMADLEEPYGVREGARREVTSANCGVRLAGGNPVAGRALRLEWQPSGQKVRLRIADACGRLVRSELLAGAAGAATLDLRRLASGVYFAELGQGAAVVHARFVLP